MPAALGVAERRETKKLIGSFLVVTWFTVAIGGCKSEASTPPSDVKTTGDAEIGASIEALDWRLTLIEPPQLMKRVSGEAGATTWDIDEPGAEIADGLWLVCPVQVTNNSDELRMLPSKLFRATDEQGREFPMTDKLAHFIRIWSTERWMSDDSQLIQNTMDVAVSREGPFIFDVAEDSTGLRLTADGIEESISLGF